MSLGTVGGIQLVLDRSWFVIAALTVVIYGPVLWGLYPRMGWWNLVLAFAFAVGLALSVLVHELAHALVGRAVGWPVHRVVLTLMGGHTSFATSRVSPGATALVSAVGPLANIALALLGTALLTQAPEHAAGPWWALLQLGVFANWVLGLFNLLPGLPLDGGRVVEAIVWRVTGNEPRATTVAAWCGYAIAAVLLVLSVALGTWRTPVVFGVTLLIVGFVALGAHQAARQARVLAALRTVAVADVARPALEVGPAASLATVDASVTALLGEGYRGWVPDVVARDAADRHVGVLNPDAAARIAPERRAHVAVGEVMTWQPMAAMADAGEHGHDAVRQMEAAGWTWLWLPDPSGRITAVVHHADIVGRALGG